MQMQMRESSPGAVISTQSGQCGLWVERPEWEDGVTVLMYGPGGIMEIHHKLSVMEAGFRASAAVKGKHPFMGLLLLPLRYFLQPSSEPDRVCPPVHKWPFIVPMVTSSCQAKCDLYRGGVSLIRSSIIMHLQWASELGIWLTCVENLFKKKKEKQDLWASTHSETALYKYVPRLSRIQKIWSSYLSPLHLIVYLWRTRVHHV